MQVKLSLHVATIETAYVTFDAKGADVTSWFDVNRVVNSSWPEIINSDFMLFSMTG